VGGNDLLSGNIFGGGLRAAGGILLQTLALPTAGTTAWLGGAIGPAVVHGKHHRVGPALASFGIGFAAPVLANLICGAALAPQAFGDLGTGVIGCLYLYSPLTFALSGIASVAISAEVWGYETVGAPNATRGVPTGFPTKKLALKGSSAMGQESSTWVTLPRRSTFSWTTPSAAPVFSNTGAGIRPTGAIATVGAVF
jgi:hypothetical protein